jgi:hypothetical protein
MPNEPTKAELEASLQSVTEKMNQRFDSLQGELTSTQDAARDALVNNPLLSIGGAVAAGLAVGWLFGGSRRRRLNKRHRELTGAYMDAVKDEVQAAIGKGEDVETAVRGVLKERVPLVVYENRTDNGSSGFLKEMLEMVARTAVSLLARDVIENVIANANLEETIDENLFS